MLNTVELATQQLLATSEVTEQNLMSIMDSAMQGKVDAADLYMQNCYDENWSLENGLVKEAGNHQDQGFGMRVIAGETVGFAFANDFTTKTLQQAVHSAHSIARGSLSHHANLNKKLSKHSLYPLQNTLHDIAAAEKVAYMLRLDQYIRQADTRVCEVMINMGASYETIMLLNSSGELHADLRPMVSLHITVLVEQAGQRERGFSGAGWRAGYDYFLNSEIGTEVADKALKQALINLKARAMPAGEMPVVLGPGWPAVILHEAVGHGLEGDFNRKGTSVYAGRIGEKVASSLCTIVDDGTLPGRRGSLNMDDEGHPTQCTTLIENGILKNYMQDSHNARLMGVASTGNARRESYAQAPLPRMTNTYMLAGKHDPAEIIASVDKGLYAVDFAGGQVDITTGTFVFSSSEAYYIENGKIQYPVKGATLIGNGPEALQRVTMVGHDLQLDRGVGQCGKAGQTVPVGVGQPTIKLSSMTVGGSQLAD